MLYHFAECRRRTTPSIGVLLHFYSVKMQRDKTVGLLVLYRLGGICHRSFYHLKAYRYNGNR